MPPRILHARLPRPVTAAAFLLFSATSGYTYRHFSSSADSPESPTLHPALFTPYTLTSTHPLTPTTALLTLHAPGPQPVLPRNAIYSLEAKQPQLQIARSYTPFPSADASAEEVRLLVRRYRGGEMSSYLHRLRPGATVELRGPHVGYVIPEGVQDVLFLAGGTGVAPGLQVAAALGGEEGARVRILWANRRREDCVGGRSDGGEEGAKGGWWGWGAKKVVEEEERAVEQGVVVRELEALKERGGVKVEYFVDEEGSFISPARVEKLLREGGEGSGRRIVLVSGPEGFVEFWAGRKVWAEEGEVQGPLRGALARMERKGWEVWKL